MSLALAHRGPDAEGAAFFDRQGSTAAADSADVALIHRRLSIIDLDARSNQPMTSSDGRYSLIYNGEIYNYLELRAELAQAGRVFRTQSDSEVLLEAYAAWGDRALNRFQGMFSFVILDRGRQELFLARDPFGIKPLYWALGSHELAVASEIPPLLDVPGVSRRADMAAVWSYLSAGQSDAGDATMFADIRSLPSASYARVSLGRPQAPRPVVYWQPTIAPRERGVAQSAAELRDLFMDSVRMHLRSDVPVGVALSGGVDSSAILCAVRAIGGARQEIHAFSFVAEGSAVDESHFIGIAADAANAVRHEVRIAPSDIVRDIDRLVRVQGEAFGSLSIYAQQRVMELAASRGIKVMLDGQGADELFAGYHPYLARRLTELLMSMNLRDTLSFSRALLRLPKAGARLLAQALEPLVPSAARGAARNMLGRPVAPPWVEAGWFERNGSFAAAPAVPKLDRLLHNALEQSLTQTVLPALLRYEDRNSMAVSVESRVPFLTPALADFAYSLPSSHLIDGHATSKAVLRAALRGLVPDVILDRKDKIGFATPDELWTQALRPWFAQVLQSDAARASPWLDAGKALQLLERRAEGNRPFGFDLWRTVNLVRWADVFNVKLA